MEKGNEHHNTEHQIQEYCNFYNLLSLNVYKVSLPFVKTTNNEDIDDWRFVSTW